MGKGTKIEWATHTFNPWIGCAHVSPGCIHCYAEVLMDQRMGRVKWGPGQPRSRTSEGNWRKPLAWNRAAQAAGRRDRVFCASLADFLDPEVPAQWLADLLLLIEKTPHLDWLLLTKRPQLWRDRMEAVESLCVRTNTRADARILVDGWLHASRPPKNVWIGTTVEDQRRADERIPFLLRIPAFIRFLSAEPMIGPVTLRPFVRRPHADPSRTETFHWVICGGESGANARPMNPRWAQLIRDECNEAKVPFLFKQHGEWAPAQKGSLPVAGRDKFTFNTGEVDEETVIRLGKRRAGRLLDGRLWDEVPTP